MQKGIDLDDDFIDDTTAMDNSTKGPWVKKKKKKNYEMVWQFHFWVISQKD